MQNLIRIRGARVNNLKNIDLDLPLNKLICFFGPSGSGKTSLAFHTLFSESKRRFLNSFPTYLKFFSDRPAPVDVDEIFPVLPVFGLPQNNPVVGTRSNVADIMHLTELFQNLFYHYSHEMCAIHKSAFVERTISDYLNSVDEIQDGKEVMTILINREDFIEYFSDQPFPSRSIKSKRSKKICEFDQEHEFWEVARFKSGKYQKADEKLKIFIESNSQLYILFENKIKDFKFEYGVNVCPEDSCEEVAFTEKSLMSFSPYNALGACSECSGFGEVLEYDEEKLFDLEKSVSDGGVSFLKYKRFAGQEKELIKELKKRKISITKPLKDLKKEFFQLLYEGAGYYHGFDAYFSYLERKRYKMHVRIFIRSIQKGVTCGSCGGTRLQPFSEQFYLDKSGSYSLNELLTLNIYETLEIFKDFSKEKLSKDQRKSVKKITDILVTAVGIGLGHLDLQRKAKTLSAGEYQRLLLLKYLSYDGRDSLFVFDEPSLGLSEKEKKELLKGFNKLIAQNNTVVLIDHSLFFRKNSDYLVGMGPGSGSLGGELEFVGLKKDYKYKNLKHELKPIKFKKRKWIEVKSPETYGKIYQDFKLPIGEITLVTGPSGSGKTASLVNVLGSKLYYDLYDEYLNIKKGSYKSVQYKHDFNDVLVVDANLNRYTSRSTVGSLTGLFNVVRKYYSQTTAAKSLGLKEGHFSYNSDLGQCPKCEGKGVNVVEMQFLEDIVLECEDCHGKRLKTIYSEIDDGTMTVHEAYSQPLNKILSRIKLTPKFQRIFEYLKILNLDYLSLNRSIQSLSGGEKQRIYLLSKLQKEMSNSIFFFENLSFGLSEKEMIKISEFLQALSAKNNTIVVIDQDDFFQNIASHTIEFK